MILFLQIFVQMLFVCQPGNIFFLGDLSKENQDLKFEFVHDKKIELS